MVKIGAGLPKLSQNKTGYPFFGPPCIAAKQRLQRVHSQCVNSGARLLPEYRVAR